MFWAFCDEWCVGIWKDSSWPISVNFWTCTWMRGLRKRCGFSCRRKWHWAFEGRFIAIENVKKLTFYYLTCMRGWAWESFYVGVREGVSCYLTVRVSLHCQSTPAESSQIRPMWFTLDFQNAHNELLGNIVDWRLHRGVFVLLLIFYYTATKRKTFFVLRKSRTGAECSCFDKQWSVFL